MTTFLNPRVNVMTDSSIAEDLNNEGMARMAGGDARGAVRLLRRATAAAPEDPIILNNLGNALVQAGEWVEARCAYERARSTDPAYARPYCNLATLDQLEGRPAAAIEAYRRYLELEPVEGEASYNLALLLLGVGEEEEALARMKAVVEDRADTSDGADTRRGVALFFLGDLDDAAHALEGALAIDRDDLMARYHLGIVRLYQGRVDECIVALREVLGVDPGYPQAAENLGVALNSAGRPAEALEVLAALLEDEPDNLSALLNLGFARMDSGDADGATAAFGRVIAEAGADSPLGVKATEAVAEALAMSAPRGSNRRQ